MCFKVSAPAEYPRRHRLGRLRFVMLALMTSTIAGNALAAGELDALFAPPTFEELAAARANWAARDPVSHDWIVERIYCRDGFEYWIVSHDLQGGLRHYGAIRFPLQFDATQKYPVLLKCHGDFDGAHEYDLTMLDEYLPSDCVPRNYIVVAPSYRGEGLYMGAFGVYQSEGAPSVNDYDVDDSIALLDGVLHNVPQADAARVAVYGTSRGATVALRVGLREPRVKLALSLYGQTDFFLPSIQAHVADVLYNGVEPADAVVSNLLSEIVYRWAAGAISTAEARMKMLLRSSVYFVERYAHPYPQLRLYHGSQDSIVPIEQSDWMDQWLTFAGAHAPTYAYRVYEQGRHSPESLTGAAEDIDAALQQLLELNVGSPDQADSPDRDASDDDSRLHRTDYDGREPSDGPDELPHADDSDHEWARRRPEAPPPQPRRSRDNRRPVSP